MEIDLELPVDEPSVRLKEWLLLVPSLVDVPWVFETVQLSDSLQFELVVVEDPLLLDELNPSPLDPELEL